jgi:hypothetical protein
MIEDIKKSSKEQHDEISRKLGERIDKVEEKVEGISKFRWQVLGGLAVIAIFVKFVPPIMSFLTPHQDNGRMERTK